MSTLLIIVGVTGGVTAASRPAVHITLFAVSTLAILAGIILRRALVRDQKMTDETASTEIGSTIDILNRIIDRTHMLQSSLGSAQPDRQAVFSEIEKILIDDFARLLSSIDGLRSSRSHAQWADVVAQMSEGERYLNRAWSSLSDDYAPESRKSLTAAVEKFEDVRDSIGNQTE
jgi:hypothetical protein